MPPSSPSGSFEAGTRAAQFGATEQLSPDGTCLQVVNAAGAGCTENRQEARLGLPAPQGSGALHGAG